MKKLYPDIYLPTKGNLFTRKTNNNDIPKQANVVMGIPIMG
jgi:hypothetical protein